MLSGRTTTTVSAPARGPLDYNSLRLSFSQLAPLFGLTLLALLPIGLGGWVTFSIEKIHPRPIDLLWFR